MVIIEYFQQFPTSYLVFVTLFSLLVGSFLNVVIYRLPVMMERDWKKQCIELLSEDKGCQCTPPDKPEKPFNLNVPRSTCPSCGHKITALENIPLVSYFFLLKGKCSGCKTPISLRYPIIEFTTALLSLLVAWKFGVSWVALFGILLTWALISLTMIDFDTMLLPDDITLPFLWIGLLLGVFGIFTDFSSLKEFGTMNFYNFLLIDQKMNYIIYILFFSIAT